jgi:hypothetical protein
MLLRIGALLLCAWLLGSAHAGAADAISTAAKSENKQATKLTAQDIAIRKSMSTAHNNQLVGYWLTSDIHGLYVNVLTKPLKDKTEAWQPTSSDVSIEYDSRGVPILLIDLHDMHVNEAPAPSDNKLSVPRSTSLPEGTFDYVGVQSTSQQQYIDPFYLDSPATKPPEFRSIRAIGSDRQWYLRVEVERGSFRATKGIVDQIIRISKVERAPSDPSLHFPESQTASLTASANQPVDPLYNPSIGNVTRFTLFSSGLEGELGAPPQDPDATMLKGMNIPFVPNWTPDEPLAEALRELSTRSTGKASTFYEINPDLSDLDKLTLDDGVPKPIDMPQNYLDSLLYLRDHYDLVFTIKKDNLRGKVIVKVNKQVDIPDVVVAKNIDKLDELDNCAFNATWDSGTPLGVALSQIFNSPCPCMPGSQLCPLAHYKLETPSVLAAKIPSADEYRTRGLSTVYAILRELSIEQELEFDVTRDDDKVTKHVSVKQRAYEAEAKQAYPKVYTLHYARASFVKQVLDKAAESAFFKGVEIEAVGVEAARPEQSSRQDDRHDQHFTQIPEEVDLKGAESLVPDTKDEAEDPFKTNELNVAPANIIIITAKEEQQLMLERIIREVDKKPNVVQLDVMVCELDDSGAENLGLHPSHNKVDAISSTFSEQATKGTNFEALSLGSFYRTGINFKLVLEDEVKKGHARILASPTLTTLEGKQATYFVGDYVPIKSGSNTRLRADSDLTTSSVGFMHVGITLNFLPRLGRHGDLSIGVRPVVSRFRDSNNDGVADYIKIGGADDIAPQLAVRELDTTANVMAEQPFVLAGMISDDDRVEFDKVPLLGDLPLAGKLFRSRKVRRSSTEVCIFVVPHVVEGNCPICGCADCICGEPFSGTE